MPRIAPLLVVLALPGCFLLPSDEITWAEADDDDATVGDDDDATDDDDSVPDDDDDTAPPQDNDGDGYTSDVDCDDGNPDIHPGAEEVWDFVVNDCDFGPPPEYFVAQSATGGDFRGVEGTEAWSQFGVAWSLGDLDGDGAADLCARKEGSEATSNDILVFSNIVQLLGENEGRVRDWMATGTITSPPGRGNVDCSEDLNGDGSTDLVFSGIHIETGAGALVVFFGTASLGHDTRQWQVADQLWTSNDNEWLGSCFAIGDFTSEAPGLEIATVTNFNGDGAVVVFPPDDYDPVAYAPRDPINDWGEVTCHAIRDLTGDGHDEIIVADWGSSTLYLSDDYSTTGDGQYMSESIVLDGHSARSGFARDITGDGVRELVLGVPDAANLEGMGSAGATMVFYGESNANRWRGSLLTFDGGPAEGRGFFIDGLASGDLLGHRVCPLGDVSGDGIADFVVTAPGSLSDGGARVFRGRDIEAWELLAGPDLTVEQGLEDSLFAGAPTMPGLGFSFGSCGYDWRSEDSPAEHLWLYSNAIDEAGTIALWKREAR